jgi:hypothetical protein
MAMQDYVAVSGQHFPREDLKEGFKMEMQGSIIAWSRT